MNLSVWSAFFGRTWLPDSIILRNCRWNPNFAWRGLEIAFSHIHLTMKSSNCQSPNRADALSMQGLWSRCTAANLFTSQKTVIGEDSASSITSVTVIKWLLMLGRVVENVGLFKSKSTMVAKPFLWMLVSVQSTMWQMWQTMSLYFGQPMHALDLDKFWRFTNRCPWCPWGWK